MHKNYNLCLKLFFSVCDISSFDEMCNELASLKENAVKREENIEFLLIKVSQYCKYSLYYCFKYFLYKFIIP